VGCIGATAAAIQVSDLKYNTLANGHGPILRYNVEQLVENYKQWSLAVEKGTVQVSIASLLWAAPWICMESARLGCRCVC
jgi:flavorubredoxin